MRTVVIITIIIIIIIYLFIYFIIIINSFFKVWKFAKYSTFGWLHCK